MNYRQAALALLVLSLLWVVAILATPHFAAIVLILGLGYCLWDAWQQPRTR